VRGMVLSDPTPLPKALVCATAVATLPSALFGERFVARCKLGAFLVELLGIRLRPPDSDNERAVRTPRPSNVARLTVQDAEALALKNNPAISVARLNALASRQVTREVSSNLWPQTYANLTGVDARSNSRITAGALNNPTVYTRAAGGAAVTQLITDFGHTTNLVASARLQARADEQNAVATKQDSKRIKSCR